VRTAINVSVMTSVTEWLPRPRGAGRRLSSFNLHLFGNCINVHCSLHGCDGLISMEPTAITAIVCHHACTWAYNLL